MRQNQMWWISFEGRAKAQQANPHALMTNVLLTHDAVQCVGGYTALTPRA
jgi:hypothetical protein